MSPFSTSVASVADKHNENREIRQTTKPDLDKKNKTEAMRLPALPCVWCDYKDPIEFDLGNHLLANHREQLLKLPIGKGSMENRIDYAVEMVKSRMAAQYDDDEDDVQENDSDDVE